MSSGGIFPPRGLLCRRHGRRCEPPLAFTGRRLRPADLGSVVSLHEASRQDVAPALVAHDSIDFFRARLGRRGRILGVFAEEALIAYGVLGLPGVGEPSFADDLPSPPPPQRVAEVDGVGVRPDLRGNGLHRLLIRWRLAEAAGRDLALSTAAPGNLFSLSNLLSCGFEAVALVRKFDGHWRFLLAHRLPAVGREREFGAGRWVAVDQIEEQRTLLGEGWRGLRLRKVPGAAARLLYLPPES